MTKKKPTYRKLREIVNGTWETLGWNFQTWWDEYWKEDPWQPDTIVFGHTHVPEGPVRIGDIEGIDEKKIKPQLKNKILVNSGCWLQEGKEDQTSFIYINNRLGILLCKFNPVENIGQELGNLEHPSFSLP